MKLLLCDAGSRFQALPLPGPYRWEEGAAQHCWHGLWLPQSWGSTSGIPMQSHPPLPLTPCSQCNLPAGDGTTAHQAPWLGEGRAPGGKGPHPAAMTEPYPLERPAWQSVQCGVPGGQTPTSVSEVAPHGWHTVTPRWWPHFHDISQQETPH